jgi:hypothetical protein
MDNLKSRVNPLLIFILVPPLYFLSKYVLNYLSVIRGSLHRWFRGRVSNEIFVCLGRWTTHYTGPVAEKRHYRIQAFYDDGSTVVKLGDAQNDNLRPQYDAVEESFRQRERDALTEGLRRAREFLL